MADLDTVADLITRDHGLSVIVTIRPDHTPSTSVVNVGIIAHPVSGERVAAFVASGAARKLARLRVDPTVAAVVRAGWQWASVEGRAELIGPDDPHPAIDEHGLATLLRDIFTAAGGTHDDWDTYDRVMREERRTAVLIAPTRISSTPS